MGWAVRSLFAAAAASPSGPAVTAIRRCGHSGRGSESDGRLPRGKGIGWAIEEGRGWSALAIERPPGSGSGSGGNCAARKAQTAIASDEDASMTMSRHGATIWIDQSVFRSHAVSDDRNSDWMGTEKQEVNFVERTRRINWQERKRDGCACAAEQALRAAGLVSHLLAVASH